MITLLVRQATPVEREHVPPNLDPAAVLKALPYVESCWWRKGDLFFQTYLEQDPMVALADRGCNLAKEVMMA